MPKLARNTGIVGALTLLSRLFGFFRDLIVAKLLGAGDLSDTFFVAFRIPNLLRSLFAEGAMTAAFVPVMAEEKEHGKEHLNNTIRAAGTLLLTGSIAVTVIGILYTPTIINLFAPGFDATPGKMERCIELTRIMLPYIIFVAFTAMINGALNTVGVFGASAMAQVLMNITLIIGGVIAGFFPLSSAVNILSISVLVGGAVQIIAQIPALRRNGLSIMPTLKFVVSSNLRILKLMIPAILGATLYQLVIFLNTVFASMLPNGAVSWLFYADRITQLPIGVFTVALASVLLPTLSKSAAAKDDGTFSKDLSDSLRYTSFAMVPIAGALMVLAEPLVEVLFQRGAFTHRDTLMTAASIQALSLGLWATSIHSMMTRAFFAKKDAITPTIIGIISLLTGVTASLALMGSPVNASHGRIDSMILYVRELLTAYLPSGSFGHVGLSFASSISATISVILSLSLIKRVSAKTTFRPFLVATVKSGIATLAAALVADLLASPSLPPSMRLLIMGCGGSLAFTAVLLMTRSQEFFDIVQKIRARSAKDKH